MIPQDLKYTREHEWIKIEETAGTIGITDYAQRQLGDITFVDLPAAGRQIKAHESIAVVESVKAASDVFAPVAGTIESVNDAIRDRPEVINTDPYHEGWICRIKDINTAEPGKLMDARQYADYLAGLK
jgi:glycine cleavage system H protein